MPGSHISNTDYHDYLALRDQKIKLQCRCSSYRQALEKALPWLKENTDIHPATTISNLAEDSVWAKLEKNETRME